MDGLPEAGKPTMQAFEAAGMAPRRPSLLPAFEPFSSSPGLPRVAKRKFDEALQERRYYPTPVPTSSTGILPSSPPSRRTRPNLQRTVSMLSERAPLGDVPTLDLAPNGEPLLMGRSSNSSDYQLSSNRHISRVHIRASYFTPDSSFPHGKIEVECMGWNGAKVHCGGDVTDLAKGDIFVSERPMSQIMVDVQDTRVMLVWPKEGSGEPLPADTGSLWVEDSPSAKRGPIQTTDFASSPPSLLALRPTSPISPVRGLDFGATFTSTFRAGSDDISPVQVYEDEASDHEVFNDPTPTQTPDGGSTPTPKYSSIRASASNILTQSQVTVASDPDDFSEHDEENDPIVHSFGPFGENILSRFESFQSISPVPARRPLRASSNSPGQSTATRQTDASPIKNHVINQLAFSRVHSLPLSTIHSNLPANLRGAMAKPSDLENQNVLTPSELKSILDSTPCVGEICREGRDAAGKLLESEFYYVPEMDVNIIRRETVTQSLGKTSIRAARKQHKQYYWKPPRY